jgi:hypothetical protein
MLVWGAIVFMNRVVVVRGMSDAVRCARDRTRVYGRIPLLINPRLPSAAEVEFGDQIVMYGHTSRSTSITNYCMRVASST